MSNDTKIAQAIEEMGASATTNAVAAETGVHSTTVARVARQLGYERSPGREGVWHRSTATAAPQDSNSSEVVEALNRIAEALIKRVPDKPNTAVTNGSIIVPLRPGVGIEQVRGATNIAAMPEATREDKLEALSLTASYLLADEVQS